MTHTHRQVSRKRSSRVGALTVFVALVGALVVLPGAEGLGASATSAESQSTWWAPPPFGGGAFIPVPKTNTGVSLPFAPPNDTYASVATSWVSPSANTGCDLSYTITGTPGGFGYISIAYNARTNRVIPFRDHPTWGGLPQQWGTPAGAGSSLASEALTMANPADDALLLASPIVQPNSGGYALTVDLASSDNGGSTITRADMASGNIVVAQFAVNGQGAGGAPGPDLISSITITCSGGTPAASPAVTSISPATGPTDGGELVTITGTGFEDGATVMIGGADCLQVTTVSTTQLTCTTPAGSAGPADVVVTNFDSLSGLLANGYTYTTREVRPSFTG